MQPDDSTLENLPSFFHGWRVELIQLGPRRDQTLVSCASFHSHRILRLHAGSALAVRGTVHKGCACVVLSGSQRAAVRFLGQPLHANALMLAGAGAPIDLFLPNGAVLFILVLESGEGISRRGLRICEGANARADGVARLVQYIRTPGQHRGEIVEPLANQVQRAMATSRIVLVDRIASNVRVSAALSACRLVEKLFPTPVTLSDLSRHCGVGERTLEYGFKQVYGTTPLAFARSQRLTRNRMALLRDAACTSISETARACGFTHMGQYSRDYRRLFGETPSMTLARSKSMHMRTPQSQRMRARQDAS